MVEMMVAIAVFSIVMVTAMSALINVINADKQAEAIKTAVDNISFALDGISRDMRMGAEYQCLDSSGNITACVSSGNAGVTFKSSKAINTYAYYKFSNYQIQSCTNTSNSGCSNFSALTSSEVTLTSVKFYVLNDDPSTQIVEQPRAIITVSGEAGSRVKTDFDLQTSVSQRTRPN